MTEQERRPLTSRLTTWQLCLRPALPSTGNVSSCITVKLSNHFLRCLSKDRSSTCCLGNICSRNSIHAQDMSSNIWTTEILSSLRLLFQNSPKYSSPIYFHSPHNSADSVCVLLYLCPLKILSPEIHMALQIYLFATVNKRVVWLMAFSSYAPNGWVVWLWWHWTKSLFKSSTIIISSPLLCNIPLSLPNPPSSKHPPF